jgi:hypothetical protein
MTTTEKRGFRLPWGAENRKSDPSDTATDGPDATPRKAASDLAPAIATDPAATGDVRSAFRRGPADDLGRGPFDLGPTADGDDAPLGSDALVDVVDPAPKRPETKPEWGVSEAAIKAEAAAAAAAAAAPPVLAEPAPAASAPAWPDMDRRGSAAHLAADTPLPPRPAVVVEGTPRKANPLMAGLVKAMRDAAKAAREEATAKLRADAATRIDEIKAEAIAASAALKKQAEEDVAAIREWSRTETARIKQEAETRIADRKARLVTQVQDQGAASERMTEEVRGGIAGFESEMDHFFEILLKEDDPARLATLAERLPEAPSFTRPSGSVVGPARRAGRSTAARRTEPGQRKARSRRRRPKPRPSPGSTTSPRPWPPTLRRSTSRPPMAAACPMRCRRRCPKR